jgi:hypothetical protein
MADIPNSIPISLRSHEIDQLHEFVPKLVRRFMGRDTEQNDMASKADELERVYEEHIEGMGNALLMPIDDWRTLISSLSDVDDGLRGWWLQRKLIRRLRDKSEELQ